MRTLAALIIAAALAGCTAEITGGSAAASGSGAGASAGASASSGSSGGAGSGSTASSTSGSSSSSSSSGSSGTAASSASSASSSSASSAGSSSSGGASSSSGGSSGGWVLTWSDEFDATDGTPPDPNTWTPEIGGDGWGNQEREYYTGELANAVQQGGSLVITATPDGASGRSCWYGACRYTSARLITQGHFSQRYGKFEARIQIPAGQGIWPAFWLLGDNIDDVGWPACGEIDVMENIGSTPATVYGSVHGTGVSHTASYDLAAGAFADDFHVYGIEWEPQTVRFYVDGDLYDTRTQQGSGGTWPFDDGPEFLLLNVAVGGSWPGDPDASTVFPQQMKVDWVRVYASP